MGFFSSVSVQYMYVAFAPLPVILEKQTQTFCISAQHYDNYQLNTRVKSKLCPTLHYIFVCLPLWNGLLWACSRVLITSKGVTKMKQKSFRNTLDTLKNVEVYRCLIIYFYDPFFFVSRGERKKRNSSYNVIRQREKGCQQTETMLSETKENYTPCMVCKTSNLSFLIY